MLNIKELLHLRGLSTTASIKLVRHKDARGDIEAICRKNLLPLYQSYQSKPVLHGCEYAVSFVGMARSKARLHGVYRVLGHKPASDVPLPVGFEYPWFMPKKGYFYNLVELSEFADLNGRVVIDWGRSALAWHQYLSEKPVVEILPIGYVREFPGYLDFVISFAELVGIIQNPEANREWQTMLRGVAGVYLITDTKSGKQYVGSAYGQGGVWGRWSEYVRTCHGGNQQLRELTCDESYAQHFQFTLLRTLPRTLTKDEVIQFEVLYKRKLGSRAFGLNSN